MKGHVRKRGKNSWAVVELPRDPETGKRRQKWVTVQGTKKDAERELAKLLNASYEGGVGTAPAKLTLGEYLDRWLEAVGPELKLSSAVSYRTAIRQWKRTALAGIPLVKLTPLDIQRAIATLLQELAPETVKRAYIALRAALRRAVKWGDNKKPHGGCKVPARRGTGDAGVDGG